MSWAKVLLCPFFLKLTYSYTIVVVAAICVFEASYLLLP